MNWFTSWCDVRRFEFLPVFLIFVFIFYFDWFHVRNDMPHKHCNEEEPVITCLYINEHMLWQFNEAVLDKLYH